MDEFAPISRAETEQNLTWQAWLENAREKKGKEVKSVPLENNDWHTVLGSDGKVESMSHKNGLFFNLVGLDAGWAQPFIEPVVDPEDPKERQGIVVMFVDQETGDMLLNTEFEIGSKAKNHISIRPTIQHSYSNIRNNGYPFADKFVSNNIPEFEARVMAMGGKTITRQIDPGRIGNDNLYVMLPVDRESIDLTNMPYHRWITQQELEEIEGDEKLLTSQFSVVNELRLNWILKGNLGKGDWRQESLEKKLEAGDIGRETGNWKLATGDI